MPGPSDDPCRACLTRRALLKAGAAGLAGLALGACGKDEGQDVPPEPYGAGTVAGSSLTVDLADPRNAPLAEVGGAVLVTVPSDLLLVARTAADAAIALSAYCTHSFCIVGFRGNEARCACHGSRYTQGGEVISGPAPEPLRAYPATLAGGLVTISLA